ncbi:MAG: hypothetical protein Q8830_03970, partial [Candidatus Phytoplasma australasiaticum]|nr:hypothetical protein [Candidatus Phytoplasma australasiaticum]
FNRRFVGGTWTGKAATRSVYNKERSEIGFKRAFRFDENTLAWYMTEYHLSDKILEHLRLRGQIRYEEFVVCYIRCNVNLDHNRENFLANSSPNSSSQCQETMKSFAQENQDLGESSAANVTHPAKLVYSQKNQV